MLQLGDRVVDEDGFTATFTHHGKTPAFGYFIYQIVEMKLPLLGLRRVTHNS